MIGTPGVNGGKGASKPGITVTNASGDTARVPASLLGPGLLPLTRTPQMSSSEAAANWLKSAQTENTTGGTDAVQKAAVSLILYKIHYLYKHTCLHK